MIHPTHRGSLLLVGRYLSPFVRRVAVAMQHFDIPYGRHVLSTLKDMDTIETYNPIARVPVLVLDTGEIIVDSAAIHEWIDARAGPEHRLMPVASGERRAALSVLMMAVGAIERAMAANGEQRRPPGEMSRERLDRLRRYCRQGFEALDRQIDKRGWLAGERMLLPDVTAAVGYTFVNRVHPGLLAENDFPALADLTRRCESTAAFKAAWVDIES